VGITEIVAKGKLYQESIDFSTDPMRIPTEFGKTS
jgi:hypothetical protein